MRVLPDAEIALPAKWRCKYPDIDRRGVERARKTEERRREIIKMRRWLNREGV